MKICIFGAGAVGGYLGARLTSSGLNVTMVARGDHLQAMQQNGLRLITPIDETVRPVNAVSTESKIDSPDFLLLCVKSHTISRALESIKLFIGDNTTVISVINGVPWWYFNEPLASVDPDGKIINAIGINKALGCVPYVGTEVVEPGVIRLFEGYNEFHLGEPDNTMSNRLAVISEAFTAAGIKTKVTSNIQYQVWRKLLGNITTNPISVLSQALMSDMAGSAGMRGLITDIMYEAMQVAASVGVKLQETPEERVAVLGKLGDFKTSMLQDYESGKQIEIEPIVGAVREIAFERNIPTPLINAVYQLLKLKVS